MARAAFSVLFNKEYITAPVTPAFWNGKPQDFEFQVDTMGKSLRERHYARFWRSGFRTMDGLLILVDTASFDDGLKWGLTHHISPIIDAERDFLRPICKKPVWSAQKVLFSLSRRFLDRI
jgi:undecaprenyl-diphosphatase